MMNKYIAKNILYKPDINWNVAGLFTQDQHIQNFIKILNDKFGVVSPITAIHGSPDVLWNSGRIPPPINKKDIERLLNTWEQMNIPIFFTFSNCTLVSEDLNDKLCNYLLDLIAERNNCGIILSSDILFDYIKSKYPKLKLIASILKSSIYNGKRNKNTLL